MTRAEYEALALRVEREEPSHELQEAIAFHLGWTWHKEGDVTFWIAPDQACWDILPFWLTSLDAAASLMPEGDRWPIVIIGPHDTQVIVRTHDERLVCESTAPDEPRARTAAAIRAIAMEKADGEGK